MRRTPLYDEHVRAGAAVSGNDPTIYAYVHVGVCERTEEALDHARKDLFSYAVVDGYARNFTDAGFGDEVAEVRARHAERDRAGALAAISERIFLPIARRNRSACPSV